MKLIIFFTFLSAIILKAGGDANRYLYDIARLDSDRVKAGVIYHIFNTSLVITLIVGMSFVQLDFWHIVYWLAMYACMNYAIFDMAYNHFANKPLFYIGNTALWDRMMRLIIKKDNTKVLYFLSKFVVLLLIILTIIFMP